MGFNQDRFTVHDSRLKGECSALLQGRLEQAGFHLTAGLARLLFPQAGIEIPEGETIILFTESR